MAMPASGKRHRHPCRMAHPARRRARV